MDDKLIQLVLQVITAIASLVAYFTARSARSTARRIQAAIDTPDRGKP